MISAINSTPSPATTGAQPPHTKPAPQQHKTETPQDTVQLSPAAQKAASGDVDHDGDSR